MATYFHGGTSEIQQSAEGLQTLYLMNPNYVPYSDAAQHPTPNMLFPNPNTTTTASPTPVAHALNLSNFSHAPPSLNHIQQHHQVGVTIPASNILRSDTPTQRSFLGQHDLSGFHSFAAAAANNPRVHYNLWGTVVADQTPPSATGTATATTASSNGSECAVTVALTAAEYSQNIGFHRPIHQQGLSLSLSSQQAPFGSLSGEVDVSPASRGGGDDVRVTGMNGVVLGSRYLKAAQELLEEVVNVGKEIMCRGESVVEGANSTKEKRKANINEWTSSSGVGSSGGGDNGGGGRSQGAELSTAQRQELQMKKSKLVTMLDEVELRYRQYHHQMEIVISSFEQAAGFGAAKSYTALALKTISKQFRCLKDAISSQIRNTCKAMGEDDFLGAKVEGSRLRYVDHHLRQQRALQQLGMIQHNAWRPQRGLPERAVSVLRAWLFEHFLHPYPKDSDKVMLAKQTGLTRSQVSNWFINARVRLWKPMVEEMYTEEIKEQEQNNNGSSSHDVNTNISKDQSSKELLWSSAAAAAAANNATTQQDQSSGATTKLINNVLHSKADHSSFNNQNTSPTEISNSNNNSFSTSPNMGGGGGGGGGGSFQSPGTSILSVDMEMKQHGDTNINRESNAKFEVERHRRDGRYSLMTTGNENHGGGGGGNYGAFSAMEDIGRFNVTDQQLAPTHRFHGNGVSLTLGLPHNENLQHGFLSHLGGRLDQMGGTNENNEFCAINNSTNPPSSSHSGTTSYDQSSIDIENRKRFAAAQLLRDFVS